MLPVGLLHSDLWYFFTALLEACKYYGVYYVSVHLLSCYLMHFYLRVLHRGQGKSRHRFCVWRKPLQLWNVDG